MGEVNATQIDELEVYSGEHEIPGIRFHPAASQLGVKAWGMSVLELEPGCDSYPEHDHADDGQEEVYVVLAGGGALIADGARREIGKGGLVRVDPDVKRKFLAGEDGLMLLVVGATPGEPYSPRG